MNKIFNINLGGYPFTIDEDAYKHLSLYLETIHKHFRSSEGYEEITSDIENRMAEIFQDELGERPIVTLKIVEATITIMGTPEEFGAEPLEDDEPLSSKRKTNYKTGKRLFRNPDDEVIGGVCSGIAAYFGVQDPIWIRLLWIVLTLSGGFGIMAYIILWVIVPMAETASDRLQMRGESINVSNIGKIIEEEMDHFSEKITELGDEFSSKKKRTGGSGNDGSAPRNAIKKGISLLGRVVSTVVKAISTILTTILKIWKPIIFIVGFALIIAFSIGLVVAIISFFLTLPFAEYIVSGPKFVAYLGALNVFVIVGVPALSIAFLVARLAFNKRMSPHWKAGMWSFFVVNVISFFAIASTQVHHFNRGNEITKVMDLTAVNSDTLIIGMQENPYDDAMFSIGDLQLAEDKLVSYDVHLRVLKSDGENFEMKQINSSRGLNAENANNLANKIKYDFNKNSNKISFPRIFTIDKDTKWRAQKVVITLSVPVGKTIRFENNADNMISRIDIDRDVERPWLDSDQYWVMEDNGLVNKDWSKKNKMNKQLNFKDFSKLQIEGKMEVEIEKGDDFKIEIMGKENYLNRLEAVQLEKTLSLVTDIQNPTSPIRLHVTMPSLELLDIRNTEEVKLQGFTESKMRLKNDGSFDIRAFINVDSLYLVQDGRGEINVRGNGKHLKVDVNRYGKIDTERFNVLTADIKAQEFSKAYISVSETVKVNSDKSSKVKVEGEAQIIETNNENID